MEHGLSNRMRDTVKKKDVQSDAVALKHEMV